MGIILWSDGDVRTRFIDPEKLADNIDGDNYWRWVEYWNRLCNQHKIQIMNRRSVRRSSGRFLRELSLTQEGSFILEAGGEIIDEGASIDNALEFLFARLVSIGRGRSEQRADTLMQKCEKIFESTGLALRDDFARRYPVNLRFASGIEHPVKFDYAIATNGHPRSLFSRVNPADDKSVTSTVGKCEWVTEQNICPKERCFVLYDGGDNDDGFSSNDIAFLNMWGRAIDVTSPEAQAVLAMAT